MANRKSYFTRLLAFDSETTGLAFNNLDPTIDSETGELYGMVSFGAIVVNAQTLRPIEELYCEIKYDTKFVWSTRAEQVHGLSQKYLDANGMTERDAMIALNQLIERHWGPNGGKESGGIRLLGHNVQTFDRFFLKRAMDRQGIPISLGSRAIDTFSLGFVMFDAYDSNELFSLVGEERAEHNALEDARLAVKAVRLAKTISNRIGEL